MWRTGLAVLAAGVIAAGVWSWWGPAEEREIRRVFDSFAGEFNGTTQEGLAAVARAVRLGRFFTDDAVIEFGGGSAPIQGRDTIVGMATRLQPRGARYRLRFEDITISELTDSEAQVSFTAVLRDRTQPAGSQSLDAREFTASLRRVDGQWRVRRATAVPTLR